MSASTQMADSDHCVVWSLKVPSNIKRRLNRITSLACKKSALKQMVDCSRHNVLSLNSSRHIKKKVNCLIEYCTW